MIANFNCICRNNSHFYGKSLNNFSFPVKGIYIAEKINSIISCIFYIYSSLRSFESEFFISQSSSITGASPSYYLVSYVRHTLAGGVLPLCRDAVGVLYSPSRLGLRSFGFYITQILLGKV